MFGVPDLDPQPRTDHGDAVPVTVRPDVQNYTRCMWQRPHKYVPLNWRGASVRERAYLHDGVRDYICVNCGREDMVSDESITV